MAIIHATASSFGSEIKNTSVPVLVDFWADWCGPCKALAPVLDEIDRQAAGSAKIVKINVDEESTLAVEFGIMSIPTMIFFKDGEVVSKMVGLRDKKDIQATLDSLK